MAFFQLKLNTKLIQIDKHPSLDNLVDNERYELLWEMIWAIVVAAPGYIHWQAVSFMVGQNDKVGTGF